MSLVNVEDILADLVLDDEGGHDVIVGRDELPKRCVG